MTLIQILNFLIECRSREISIPEKGMVSQVQLLTNCGLGCFVTDKNMFHWTNSPFHSWSTTEESRVSVIQVPTVLLANLQSLSQWFWVVLASSEWIWNVCAPSSSSPCTRQGCWPIDVDLFCLSLQSQTMTRHNFGGMLECHEWLKQYKLNIVGVV